MDKIKVVVPMVVLILAAGGGGCSESRVTGPSPASNIRAPGQAGESSPLSATIQFGLPDVGTDYPPSAEHDQSAHAKDNLVPRSVVIAVGGTVTFDVPAGAHQVAIYAPGTEP